MEDFGDIVILNVDHMRRNCLNKISVPEFCEGIESAYEEVLYNLALSLSNNNNNNNNKSSSFQSLRLPTD
jgi:hypothetical protein